MSSAAGCTARRSPTPSPSTPTRRTARIVSAGSPASHASISAASDSGLGWRGIRPRFDACPVTQSPTLRVDLPRRGPSRSALAETIVRRGPSAQHPEGRRWYRTGAPVVPAGRERCPSTPFRAVEEPCGESGRGSRVAADGAHDATGARVERQEAGAAIGAAVQAPVCLGAPAESSDGACSADDGGGCGSGHHGGASVLSRRAGRAPSDIGVAAAGPLHGCTLRRSGGRFSARATRRSGMVLRGARTAGVAQGCH
jgi:hypothetical protein